MTKNFKKWKITNSDLKRSVSKYAQCSQLSGFMRKALTKCWADNYFPKDTTTLSIIYKNAIDYNSLLEHRLSYIQNYLPFFTKHSRLATDNLQNIWIRVSLFRSTLNKLSQNKINIQYLK